MKITEKIKIKKSIYYIVLALFTGLVGYISLGKGVDFDVCTGFKGDGLGAMSTIKGIQENGFWGIWYNNRIGVPDGAALIDYPYMGNVMAILIWMISRFTSSTSRIMYIYFILTFVLDGVSMAFLLRKLEFNKETVFVIGSLFSFAPYHFYRYLLGHVTLINYMFVPMAIYLSLNILEIIDNEDKWKVALCTLFLGLGYGYYYAFGLIMLAIAYLVKFIELEDKKEIIKKLWIIALLFATIFVTFIPKILYSFVNGKNTVAGARVFYEQEIYGLKIINLLLPVSYSRIEILKNLTSSYIFSGAPLVTENSAASLGFIGSIGFIILCIALIISLTKKKECVGKDWKLVDFCSLTTLTFILMSAIGGFGEIFNWAITSQIRCYNRSSIFIMGLSLMMVAILLNKIEKKSFSIIMCFIILGVGCFDQVNIADSNWQKDIKSLQEDYEDYFAKVEESLDEGAMVYQLPYMSFPEAGAINELTDYKHFIAYLFTDNLKWSYGAVIGRDSVVKELNIDDGMSYVFLNEIKSKGFQAVYIDTDGYADNGEHILKFYDSLDTVPIVSRDEKLYVYDISELETSEK